MEALNTPEAIAAREEAAKAKAADPDKMKGLAKEGGGKDAWAKGWYHVRFNNRLHKYGRPEAVSFDSFNSEFGLKNCYNDNGKPLEPSMYVKKIIGFKKSVDNVAYAAGLPETFDFGGRTFVNLFHPNSIPPTAEEDTPEGVAAVALIRSHILHMCHGNKEYAWIIESWMALNIREPGKLVGWAIMMKGIQGDGKSTVFDIVMASCLGHANVGIVSSKELKTDFNPWAYGKAYRHIAELKAAGSSRYEVEDTLKPHITDPTVRMVGKGANGEEIPNRTNYVGTTNHEDSIPLSDDDRRWFIIFTPWRSIEELCEIIGCEDHDQYFIELRAAAYACGPQMRRYLMEMELHPKVFHGSRALDTEFKRKMVKAEYTNAGGEEFDILLEEGVYGVSRDVVIPKILMTRLIGAVGQQQAPKQKTLATLIQSRGFHKVDPKIKWRTMVKTVYVRDKDLADRANSDEIDNSANDEIRMLLDATVPKAALTFNDNNPQNESENIKAYEESMSDYWSGKKKRDGGF